MSAQNPPQRSSCNNLFEVNVNPDANLIMRCVNGSKHYHVIRGILTTASSVFRNKLEAFDRDHPQAGNRKDKPILKVHEEDKTLETLLHICYPVPNPPFDDITHVEAVCKAGRQYKIDVVIAACAEYLSKTVTSLEPGPVTLQIYKVALECGLIDIARAAAQRSLELSSAEMEGELHDFRKACQIIILLKLSSSMTRFQLASGRKDPDYEPPPLAIRPVYSGKDVRAASSTTKVTTGKTGTVQRLPHSDSLQLPAASHHKKHRPVSLQSVRFVSIEPQTAPLQDRAAFPSSAYNPGFHFTADESSAMRATSINGRHCACMAARSPAGYADLVAEAVEEQSNVFLSGILVAYRGLQEFGMRSARLKSRIARDAAVYKLYERGLCRHAVLNKFETIANKLLEEPNLITEEVSRLHPI